MTLSPTVRRGAASLAGAVLLAVAIWLAYDTVHAMDGPWGSPGTRGTLTVAECVTEHNGGGDPSTMTCTGTFTSGRLATTGVHLDLDHVSAWAPGETYQVRLPHGSRTAYQTGGQGWLIRLGFFLALLAFAVMAFGSVVPARRTRYVQSAAAIIMVSAFAVPILVLLFSLALDRR